MTDHRTVKAEYSPSSNSRCAECMDHIDEDTLRMGVERKKPNTFRYFHPECFYPPAYLTSWKDVQNANALKRKDRMLLKRMIEHQRPSRYAQPKHKRAHDDDEKEQQLREKYEKMQLPQLKEVLHYNDQTMSGRKAQLVDQCVDGEMYGALERCPQCGVGHVHPHKKDGDVVYSCAGYYEKEAGVYRPCPYSSHDAPRVEWRMPGQPKPQRLPSILKKYNLKTKITPAMEYQPARDAADTALELAREMKLDLPKDDRAARLAVGVIMLDNKRDDDSFDLKSTLETAARRHPPKQKELPPNHDLAEAFGELSAYEGHFGDTWRAVAYRRAASAIEDLPFKLDKDKHTDGFLLKKENHIEHIGKSSVHHIEEWLKTGKIEELERLRKEVEVQEEEDEASSKFKKAKE
eukprot:m.215300 g.215300  ORF g.215300 m.215300 type:complete len:405 (+) comp22203_c0_seq2:6385-7599(+)